jgi:putative methyltransferase
VIALDVDKKRCKLLEETVSIMGAAHVVSVMNKDFLKIDPSKEPFCAVEGIMLDPSCSGSGTLSIVFDYPLYSM